MHRYHVGIQSDFHMLLDSTDTNQVLVRSEFQVHFTSWSIIFDETQGTFLTALTTLLFLIKSTSAEQIIYCLVGNVNYTVSFKKFGGRKEIHYEVFQAKLYFTHHLS